MFVHCYLILSSHLDGSSSIPTILTERGLHELATCDFLNPHSFLSYNRSLYLVLSYRFSKVVADTFGNVIAFPER